VTHGGLGLSSWKAKVLRLTRKGFKFAHWLKEVSCCVVFVSFCHLDIAAELEKVSRWLEKASWKRFGSPDKQRFGPIGVRRGLEEVRRGKPGVGRKRSHSAQDVQMG
jgi:hypothetical protein